jgi:signal transduction protein with GAF and PtsI domain
MGVEDMPVGRLEGQTIIADGYRGDVFINPSDLVRREFLRLQTQESELTEVLKDISAQPSVTPDGVNIPLYLNIGLVRGIENEVHDSGDGGFPGKNCNCVFIARRWRPLRRGRSPCAPSMWAETRCSPIFR